jgi:hypothetical protein
MILQTPGVIETLDIVLIIDSKSLTRPRKPCTLRRRLQRLRQRVENEGDFQAKRSEVKANHLLRWSWQVKSTLSMKKLGFDEEFCFDAGGGTS